MENGFLKDIGESTATEEKQEQLTQAIRDGKITFFMAKRGYRAVGMCSVAKCFSTFACTDTGVFDDFYIEPVFRRKGIARKLAQVAQDWCKENGLLNCGVTMLGFLQHHDMLDETKVREFLKTVAEPNDQAQGGLQKMEG